MHNGLPLGPQWMANRSVSKLLAHEWLIRSLAEGCCRSLNALFTLLSHLLFPPLPFCQIVSRRVVIINPLTPSKTTIQFVLAELYFYWVYLQHITWYKVLLAVPHFKPETKPGYLCALPSVSSKRRGSYSPAKWPYRIHHPYYWRNPNLWNSEDLISTQDGWAEEQVHHFVAWQGLNFWGSSVTRDVRIHCKLGWPAHAYPLTTTATALCHN